MRKVSLRASDMRVDVSAIARAQGGGGHRAAAGFSTSMPWDELVAFLREQLTAAAGKPSAERVSAPPAGDGLLLCDKPAGITSHDVVAQTRRRLGRGVKVGHAGTLDPFATGLLIVLVGRATRDAAVRDGAAEALRGDGAVRRGLDHRRSRGRDHGNRSGP